MIAPSAWVVRWGHLVTPGGTVLDLAAGSGRHSAWFAARGHVVTAVDRDGDALRLLPGAVNTLVADIEQDPWPLPGRTFDGVVVTNYLWRPLFGAIVEAVGPGGVLIYETFATGQETVGRPKRLDFLLAHGELLGRVASLRIVAFEDGFLSAPERFVQRIVAVREAAAPPAPRFLLGEAAAASRSVESSGQGSSE